jgi:hypothetical protein
MKRRTGNKTSQSSSVQILPSFEKLAKGLNLSLLQNFCHTIIAGLVSPGLWFHISKAVCLHWQVSFSGGQRVIRGRRLPGVIRE